MRGEERVGKGCHEKASGSLNANAQICSKSGATLHTSTDNKRNVYGLV